MKKNNMRILVCILACMMLLTGCGSNTRKGVKLLEDGKYEDAITLFQEDIAKEKHLDEANRGMAIAYFELEKYAEAVECFEKALENEAEKTASIYHLMGTAAMKSENYQVAVSCFDESLKMEDCTDAMKKEMMFNKVVAYEKMLEWSSAKEAANTYLEAYPDDEAMQKEAAFLETR